MGPWLPTLTCAFRNLFGTWSGYGGFTGGITPQGFSQNTQSPQGGGTTAPQSGGTTSPGATQTQSAPSGERRGGITTQSGDRREGSSTQSGERREGAGGLAGERSGGGQRGTVNFGQRGDREAVRVRVGGDR